MLVDDFLAAARAYNGVKWTHQGRSRFGLDCVGLVIVAAADIGIAVPDMQGYRRTPDPSVFLSHIRANSLAAATIRDGDLAIFSDGTQPCHVGIFSTMHGQRAFIHSYAGTGKVMEELFIHEWPRQLIETRRLPEFA